MMFGIMEAWAPVKVDRMSLRVGARTGGLMVEVTDSKPQTRSRVT